MSELLFDFTEMASEVSAFSDLADRFIDPGSRHVLPQFLQNLETYRAQATSGTAFWSIAESTPLKTIASRGEYEIAGRGKLNVFAEISSTWEIRRVPPTKHKRDRAKHFRLIGIASTRVRIKSEADGVHPECELAMWRMEVGDRASPGCHFHVQVLGASEDSPFPKSLSVPRLPSIIMTPMAVTEFVLAELFQDSWAKHVAQDSPALNRWAPVQKKRLTSLLQWKMGTLASGGSPWTTMKVSKPNDDLFVS